MAGEKEGGDKYLISPYADELKMQLEKIKEIAKAYTTDIVNAKDSVLHAVIINDSIE